MVMEETPSPHVVGREFVRQYYTLLNQAPMHLHRFYNEHSSFVHGGLDNGTHETKPVIGQRQIHQCITQLDFNDCHAKIQQVDSQATLGNGVVVQVTGELSNNGGPMRRFTQTFVLAQQSPKKYYVHNDIFRYQDEMVNDEEPDYNRAEPEGEEPTKEIINRGPANIMNYYNETQPANPPMQQPPMGYPPQGMVESVPQPIQVNPVMMQQNNIPVNNYMPEAREVPAQQQQQSAINIPEAEPEEVVQEPEVVEAKPEEASPPAQLQPAEEVVVVEENRGPKTYSSMFKSKAQSSAPPQMRTKSPIVQAEAPQPTVKATSPQSGGQGGQQHQHNSLPPRQNMQKQGGPGNNKPRGDPRGDSRGPHRNGNGHDDKRESMGRERERDNRDRDMQNGDDRRRSLGGPGGGPARYPDSHQVFVGNIPLDAPDNEVRNVFSKFGNVIDIRVIHSKVTGKVFPKYGFVIFSDTTAVHNCLSSKPVMMPGDTPHNLNVEEKRPRNQTSVGERGGGMGGGNRGGRGGYRPNYDRADR